MRIALTCSRRIAARSGSKTVISVHRYGADEISVPRVVAYRRHLPIMNHKPARWATTQMQYGHSMVRVRSAWLAVAALVFIAACCQAAEAQSAEMKVISSDATDARTVQIGVNKSVVIEFPRDVAKVLVGGTGNQQSGNHPDIVTLVPLTGRRFSIIGLALGTTNAFFMTLLTGGLAHSLSG